MVKKFIYRIMYESSIFKRYPKILHHFLIPALFPFFKVEIEFIIFIRYIHFYYIIIKNIYPISYLTSVSFIVELRTFFSLFSPPLLQFFFYHQTECSSGVLEGVSIFFQTINSYLLIILFF